MLLVAFKDNVSFYFLPVHTSCGTIVVKHFSIYDIAKSKHQIRSLSFSVIL